MVVDVTGDSVDSVEQSRFDKLSDQNSLIPTAAEPAEASKNEHSSAAEPAEASKTEHSSATEPVETLKTEHSSAADLVEASKRPAG